MTELQFEGESERRISHALLRFEICISFIFWALWSCQEPAWTCLSPLLPRPSANVDVVGEGETCANADKCTISVGTVRISFHDAKKIPTNLSSSSSSGRRRSSITAQIRVETPPLRRPVPYLPAAGALVICLN
jgi:hypothetical protein